MRSTVEEPNVSGGRPGLLQPNAHINGVDLHAPTAAELDQALTRVFEMGRLCRVSPINSKDLRRARSDRVFRGMLSRMDLRVPEANVGALSAWMKRSPLPSNRIRTDLLHPVLSVARNMEASVFFLGGTDSEPFEWASRARRLYRGLRIAGAHAPGPDFRDAEGGRRLVERINDSQADVVVALPSTTRGEEFSFRYGKRLQSSLYLDVRHGPRPVLARDVPCGQSPVLQRKTRVAAKTRRVQLVVD